MAEAGTGTRWLSDQYSKAEFRECTQHAKETCKSATQAQTGTDTGADAEADTGASSPGNAEMSLQPANGDPEKEEGGMGGLSLNGEGLLRAAALSAAQDSGGGSLGISEGALFGKKGASADAPEVRASSSCCNPYAFHALHLLCAVARCIPHCALDHW